ncbi:uncharacterized protein CCOS01_07979 [Colletotrichum costaricense]|uniref:SUR7 protein n=1 Tax=Colletotrichum costaricense TaxID=1209916 RepID=A0AAJ0E1T3_9PEZI|nr:uncharacterized protein CCOS01_07979 [Colletotrichum costaricense]KAK1527717.1 hypothetical protein CCOS01_07979 [Colletotrichum costaricense]
MNVSAQDDSPSQGKKYTLNQTQERAVRRLLFLCALVFDALTVTLVVFLCVGAWNKSSGLRSSKGLNNREAHLATWSAAYVRRWPADETTVVFSWHLSSYCYSHLGREACIRRAPGAPFDLDDIMDDVALAIGGGSTYSSSRGTFPALESQGIDLGTASEVTSSKNAFIAYIIFMVAVACLWSWHFFVSTVPGAPNCDRFLAVSFTLAGAALLVASANTTRAALEADGVLAQYESVFKYHSAGTSTLVVTWIASASHFLAVTMYTVAAAIGKRLRKPDRYPPESEPSDMGRTNDARRAREAEVPAQVDRDHSYMRRLEAFMRVRGQRRRSELNSFRMNHNSGDYRRTDANGDIWLPVYSRADPIATRAPVKPNVVTGPSIGIPDASAATGGQSRAGNVVDEPAPAYERYQTASSRRP